MEAQPSLVPLTREALEQTRIEATRRIALADTINQGIYRTGGYGMLALGLGVYLDDGYHQWLGNGVSQLFEAVRPLSHAEHVWLWLLALFTGIVIGSLAYMLRYPQSRGVTLALGDMITWAPDSSDSQDKAPSTASGAMLLRVA